MNNKPPRTLPRRAYASALAVSALLAACGGGADNPNANASVNASVATGTTVLTLAGPDAVSADGVKAQPTFHIAPVLLDTPSDADATNPNASAQWAPRTQSVPAEFAHLSTRQLTLNDLHAVRRSVSLSAASTSVSPQAGATAVATYSPAQIRAAYGLPALPAAGATLTAAQAAQFGAGQTIYVVDAMHDPNVAAELAAFNQKFGLGACTTKSVTAVPLAAASSTGCDLVLAYTSASGALTTSPPAYDAGWATEIALDVQWAHAIAPLARVVLIEAPDASTTSLQGAVKLANQMGPGVVSMSFGANEGSWTGGMDSTFTGAGMTYAAATGDNGAAVIWPAVSGNVLAVGGTSLTYSGSGARSEVVWSGTGGGVSAYTATPAYQTSSVPGMGTPGHRSVADVAFNADPNTGQYVAVINQGSTAVGWVSAGGTSLATPQWAGLIAVGNAMRVQAGKAVLGAPHATLYGQSTSATTYASVFSDIKTGSDGTCATCVAKTGYDTPTGLGTPNGTALLAAISGAQLPATPPVVTGATITGTVGTALSFTASVTAPNPVTYSLTGAPSGMSISSTGVVTWATPLAGTYSVTVVAKDSKTGLSGQGVYTVTIAGPKPPVVSTGTISGTTGTALSFTVAVTDANPYTLSLTGAPSGMTISSAGVVSWPSPVAGTYSVTVTAKDSKTGLSGTGVYTVAVSAPLPPSVAASTINGKPGTALSFTVAVTAANPVTYALSGAPSGMTISTAGVVSWASPVLGSYSVTVTAKDSKTGLSGSGVLTVKIANAGPTITAAPITGVAGKAVSGTITLADTGAASLQVAISGAPLGMSFTVSGMNVVASWANPVTGSYTLKVTVTDNLGLSATANIPVTINAK